MMYHDLLPANFPVDSAFGGRISGSVHCHKVGLQLLHYTGDTCQCEDSITLAIKGIHINMPQISTLHLKVWRHHMKVLNKIPRIKHC